MINKLILWPLLVQVTLTFILLMRLGRVRFKTLEAGILKIKDIALGEKVWPEQALKASNSYQSQFEVPVLFYLACVVSMIAQLNSNLFVVLSWVFVISRILHAYVHSSSNHVPRRFQLFLLGVVSAFSMWAIIALNLLT